MLLLTLERLSPLERAAFLLHDVFDMDYADVARSLERSEAACRQLVTRAREHVRMSRPRYAADDDAKWRLADEFRAAAITGDVTRIAQMLADDAVLYSDSGGKRFVQDAPTRGKDQILRIFSNASGKRPLPRPEEIERAVVNGMPGVVIRGPFGIETIALEVVDGRIAALYVMANPEKLKHLH